MPVKNLVTHIFQTRLTYQHSTEQLKSLSDQENIKSLAVAMMKQAVADAQYLHCIRGGELAAWRSAVQWIEVEGVEADDWPLSFRNCCEVLGIDYRRARDKLLALAYSAEKEV